MKVSRSTVIAKGHRRNAAELREFSPAASSTIDDTRFSKKSGAVGSLDDAGLGSRFPYSMGKNREYMGFIVEFRNFTAFKASISAGDSTIFPALDNREKLRANWECRTD